MNGAVEAVFAVRSWFFVCGVVQQLSAWSVLQSQVCMFGPPLVLAQVGSSFGAAGSVQEGFCLVWL